MPGAGNHRASCTWHPGPIQVRLEFRTGLNALHAPPAPGAPILGQFRWERDSRLPDSQVVETAVQEGCCLVRAGVVERQGLLFGSLLRLARPGLARGMRKCRGQGEVGRTARSNV